MASRSDQPVTEDSRSKDTRRGERKLIQNDNRPPECSDTKQTVLDNMSATEQILSNTSPESESDSRGIKFDETLLNEFKRDYHRCGKYNLESQVVHLVRLADHYKKRYEASGHWTDCLKAHSLYNSCNARKSKSVISAKKAFQMQQAYWNDSTSFSYEDQRTLTESLVGELEAIRTEEKNQLSGISDIVQSFESEPDDDLRNKFSESMQNISLGCTQEMREFAGRIIKKSVSILGQEPPCGFEAVAIGSLARGDATPYSDLEYIFLIEDENKKSEAYFERLAVTSYFLIGNLGETKLSYMAIEELAGWFNDCSKNGFKIDGLSKEAGNIPTGNGTETKRNQFIITPIKLAERYGRVLNNPDGNQSRKGDLTAMLKFTNSLYVYRQGSQLLKTLRDKMAEFVANESRKQANIEMLRSDMAKFEFTPDTNFLIHGLAVDVKRQMYRFPSLLVLDLSIVFDVDCASCWDVVYTMNVSSELLRKYVNFRLACASYIRLAAYIFHDSHNDAMSVAGAAQLVRGSHCKSHQQQRWQAPRGLFYDFCDKMILRFGMTDGSAYLLPSHWINLFTTLYFCGNNDEALCLMKRKLGRLTYVKIDALVEEIATEADRPYCMLTIAHVLSLTDNGDISLQIYSRYQASRSVYYALALIEVGRHAEASNILSVAEHSPFVYHALSILNVKRERYDSAEENLIKALQMESASNSEEMTYNYHGEVEADNDYESQRYGKDLLLPTNVELLLKSTTDANSNILLIMSDLSRIYIIKKLYKLAEITLEKVLKLSFELYGDENSRIAAFTYLTLGELYGCRGNNEKVDQYFKRSTSIQNKLSKRGKVSAADSEDTVKALVNIAAHYTAMKSYIKNEEFLTKALAMFQSFPPDTRSAETAMTLFRKGLNYYIMENYMKAVECYSEASVIFRKLSCDTDSVYEAKILRNMGANFSTMKNCSKTDECYIYALEMLRKLSPYSVSTLLILRQLGVNNQMVGNYSKAVGQYTKALSIFDSLYPDTCIMAYRELVQMFSNLFDCLK